MEYRIIWRNTATKQVLVQTAQDLSQSGSYYRFPLMAGMPKGEYEYYIIASGGTLAIDQNDPRKSTIDGQPVEVYDCGVAQCGHIARSVENYVAVKEYQFYGG